MVEPWLHLTAQKSTETLLVTHCETSACVRPAVLLCQIHHRGRQRYDVAAWPELPLSCETKHVLSQWGLWHGHVNVPV